MPTVDFTLEDIRQIMRQEIEHERTYTHSIIDELENKLTGEIGRVRQMLEEDAQAESGRLDQMSRRLDRHITNHSIHHQS
jgi:hypothetical protein